MTRFLRSGVFILLFTAAACSGGDDGTSAGESSTGSTSSSGATTSTTGAGSATTSASASAGTDSGTGTESTSGGSTTAPGTTGTGTTDPGTTAPGTTDPGTTGTTGTTDPGTTGTTDPGTTGTGTTGMGVDCSMLGPNQCKAEPMCMAIQGQKQNTQKMCLQKVMFYDCAPAGACGDAITVACDPMVMPPEPVQFPDTCIPDGWMPCDFPPLDKGC
ncbi:MAG TPA: hypothetical protein PKW35_18690 [Nannocystaceae bacterium]|nr:hypothetical protein [Nannocystaceae bacterium]